MRPKVSVYIATSLDGFIARENGDIEWLHEGPHLEGEDFGYAAFMGSVDVLVMGRRSFEKVLTFGEWPYTKRVVVLSSGEVAIPERLSGKVEGTSLPPAALLDRLSKEGATHVYLDGGVTIQRFLAEGLVDELTITRIPVLLGQGLPLFGPLGKDVRLDHVETRAFDNGFVQSKYRIGHGNPG